MNYPTPLMHFNWQIMRRTAQPLYSAIQKRLVNRIVDRFEWNSPSHAGRRRNLLVEGNAVWTEYQSPLGVRRYPTLINERVDLFIR